MLVVASVGFSILRSNEVREAGRRVLNSFWDKKIVIPLVFFGSYIAASLWLASRIGLWNMDLLGPTIVWFLLAGIPMFVGITDALKDPSYWKRTIVGTFGIGVLVDFVMNLTDFGFQVELILQSILIVLALLYWVSGIEPRHASVRKALAVLLGLVWVAFATLTIREIYDQRPSFALNELALSFALVLWLPLIALPCLYLIALYAAYENVFIRLSYGPLSKNLNRRTQLALVLGLNLRLYAVTSLRPALAGEVLGSPRFTDTLRGAWRYERPRIFSELAPVETHE